MDVENDVTGKLNDKSEMLIMAMSKWRKHGKFTERSPDD